VNAIEVDLQQAEKLYEQARRFKTDAVIRHLNLPVAATAGQL